MPADDNNLYALLSCFCCFILNLTLLTSGRVFRAAVDDDYGGNNAYANSYMFQCEILTIRGARLAVHLERSVLHNCPNQCHVSVSASEFRSWNEHNEPQKLAQSTFNQFDACVRLRVCVCVSLEQLAVFPFPYKLPVHAPTTHISIATTNYDYFLCTRYLINRCQLPPTWHFMGQTILSHANKCHQITHSQMFHVLYIIYI